jgi:hypothetical protein
MIFDEFGMIDTALDLPLPLSGMFFPVPVGQAANTTCLGVPTPEERALCFDPKHKDLSTDRPRACGDHAQLGSTIVGYNASWSYTCRQCMCNLHNALVKRHGAKQNEATISFVHFMKDFDSVNELRCSYLLYFEIWYDHWITKWPQSKQEAIHRSMLEDPFAPSEVKAFIKRECGHKLPSKARMIQMYKNLHTQSRWAPTFYAAQKAVCSVFHRHKINDAVDITITIASGMNAEALADWMTTTMATRTNPHFYERDGKNWDASMQEIHHDLKKWVLRKFIYDEDFFGFLDDCASVRGSATKKKDIGPRLVYKLKYTVKSGHNDTTLGNSIVNAAIAYEACSRMGLSADILVIGDDLLVVVEGDFDHHALAAIERSLGIVPEYEKFHHPWQVEFASSIWLPNGEGTFAYVPKPGRVISRLFWTVNPPSRKKMNDYIHTVVCGMRHNCGAIPIVRKYLDIHDRAGNIISVGRKVYDTTQFHNEGQSLENSLMLRYHISAQEIIDVETYLDGLPRLGAGIISHPVLDKLMSVDLADVTDRFANT